MGDLRTPRLNMGDQKLKMGDFRRPIPNMGDQKSPKLPLDLTVVIIIPGFILIYLLFHSIAAIGLYQGTMLLGCLEHSKEVTGKWQPL